MPIRLPSVAQRPSFGPRTVLVILVALVATPFVDVRAQITGVSDLVPVYSEHEVKAAFLFHFAAYVTWPEQRAERPLVFAVLSAPKVAEALEQFAEARQIRGQQVRVREIRSVQDLDEIAVLFVGRRPHPPLSAIASSLPRGTLLVTEADDGLAEGAMINFRLVERRVRFEVSLASVHAAGLKISSRLLSVALRVDTSFCWPACVPPDTREWLPIGALAVSDPGEDARWRHQKVHSRVRR